MLSHNILLPLKKATAKEEMFEINEGCSCRILMEDAHGDYLRYKLDDNAVYFEMMNV